MANLVIQLSDGRTMSHVLSAVPQIIGRDASCEIPIDDPSTSRRHARFIPTSDGYLVEDLGSKNGTLVNDAPCHKQLLKEGDRIALGSTVAVFHATTVPDAPSVIIQDDAPTSHSTRYVGSDERLRLSQQRLQMIYELSGRLTRLQDRDRLLDDALTICFETLHFERGAVGIRRPNQRQVDWPIVRNLRGREGELTISRTLLSRALEHAERAIYTESDPGMADPTMSIVQQGIRSAMCVPLLSQNQTLGVIYGDRISTSTAYTSEDIDFFAAIAQQVSIGLVNCRLMDERQQMVRLQHDLDLARRIQNGLLPTNLPDRAELKVAAINDPGQRVSGDYYDVVETSDGRLWCLMADVTGEGMSAALLMANLQAAVRATIDSCDDPSALMERWNRQICRNTEGSKFITCLLALVDPKRRILQFANAGHLSPILITRANAAAMLDSVETSFPLGIEADARFRTSTVALPADPFLLFCYTDGVIEAFDEHGAAYGTPKLLESLSDLSELDPGALVKRIRKIVSQHVGAAAQSDDITLLAVLVG